ncbi:MAG: CDP-glycerol glycerophosphotransferase family protein, partial [Helicobacter sp.]|nr:CDP-glycerol glycerophosphotransferase family protein [Helicobacter sp.]
IIEWLLANTCYTILVRVHPLVFAAKQRPFTLLQLKFAQNPRVVFDTSMGSDFYDNIDFMVTDASTTGFSFAFSTLRPCFFFMPRSTGGAIAENAHQIGGIARNFAELGALIARAEQNDFAPRIRAFRDEIVYHVGNSAQILADKIDAILG